MSWQLTASLAVALTSGLLYGWCVRLRPVAVAAWLAPLPLLLLAPRVPEEFAVGAAAAAWLIGQSTLARYAIRVLKRPWWVVVVEWLGGSIALGAIVAVIRGYLDAGHLVVATVAFPAAWVTLEYLVALRSPHGAWWSIGYTQTDRPSVIQVASLTGVWGVSALVFLPAAAVAAAAAPTGSAAERASVLLAAAAVLAAVLGYGHHRSRRPPRGEAAHLGLAAQPDLTVVTGTGEGVAVLARYLEQVRTLADRGARLIVLPEVAFRVPGEHPADQLRPFAGLASELDVTVVVGVAGRAAERPANLALRFDPGDQAPGVYVKRHLVPRLEAEYHPGRELLLDSRRGLGVLICKDLDFPGLVRSSRRAGARLLLVPAWDFGSDGWLHSRMAVMRGVESGSAVARVARNGRATISDAHGRIVADVETTQAASVSATARLATDPTVYTRLGGWFAWCCIAITASALLLPHVT